MPGYPCRVVIAAFPLVLLASSANAGGSPRAHDGGFFLRLSAGGGYASTEFDDIDGNNKLSGSAGDVDFAAGAIVAENLAVHGTVFGWRASKPTFELNGTELGDLDADLDLTAFGGGVTYYFMPANIYISGSLGLGSLTIDTGNVSFETDMGPVVDVTLGKEWWVGGNWGLGAAGSLGWHSVGLGEGIHENSSGLSLALRFTATMN